MVKTMALGERQSNVGWKRNGRKRARNKSTDKKFFSTNPRFVLLQVAGVAIVCSLDLAVGPVSFSFAFYNPSTLTTMKNPANRGNSLRKNNNLRRSRILATYTTIDDDDDARDKKCSLLDTIDESHEKTSPQRTNRNIDSGESLVVASSSSLQSTATVPSLLHLPCWLAWIKDEFAGMSSLGESSKRVRREIELLEDSLLSFRGGDFFSKSDVRDLIQAIYWCASNSEDRSTNQKLSKIVGSVSFCRLLLQLEDDTFDSEHSNRNKKRIVSNSRDNRSYLITKDVLLASIIHYSECFEARYDGSHEDVRKDLFKVRSNGIGDENDVNDVSALHKSLALAMINGGENLKKLDRGSTPNYSSEDTSIVLKDKNPSRMLPHSSTAMILSPELIDNNMNDGSFNNIFSNESLELANAAMRLKRIEILVSATLTSNGKQQNGRRSLNKEEYAAARNLMVSLTDDWRALAIRCVASLYRLEGILKHSKMNAGTGEFSSRDSMQGKENTLAAKDSLKMYANLSEQMGLHRLHSQLEARAFRILYPRQYSASSALFQEHGAAMKAISSFLSNELKQMLYEDSSLMFELEDLEVLARVKEPFSFWKKLLKKRIRSIAVSASDVGIDSSKNQNSVAKNTPQRQISGSANNLSILEVNDGVALRVILKARKLHVEESDETTRERERFLCYYVHHSVRSRWPEIDQKRVKDYVRYPKVNGYQSLHHTSKITRNGQDFFFEVQIRSQEMHRVAEFGVAAHSAYKLGDSSSSIRPPLLPSSCPSLSTSSSPEVSSAIVKRHNPLDQSSTLTIPAAIEKCATDSCKLAIVGASDSGNAGPYIHALQKTRQNLMQSYVYVFLVGGSSSTLETGQLLTLSAGSRVIDVLDTLRQSNEKLTFKYHELSVWCNGKLALLDEKIGNGDMILITPLNSPSSSITQILANETSSSNAILVS